MINQDPITKVERVVKDVHDSASRYTEPVLQRYPLIFAFLVIFGASAILHGFELWSDKIVLFKDHPTILIIVGTIVLLLTGRLYRFLDKNK